jgi:hypothetical protein
VSNHVKAGAAVTAAVGCLMAMTVGFPLLAVAGLAGSGDPFGAGGGLKADGIPPTAALAYQRAADAARHFDPACEIPPWILAGVGQIESRHGTAGGAAASTSGDVLPRIVGPALPALGDDTDDGKWDGDPSVDHAVGPMQFIPTTWRIYGLDGNHDGVIDPHNLYDAELTAAAYLCAAGGPMATKDDWRRGLLAYNHSSAYVADVLKAAKGYREDPTTQQAAATPGAAVHVVNVAGIGPTNIEWSHQVEAMLAAAESDGLTLTGSSYRHPAQQIALRRAHCGTSHYATYDMPASQCSPPTARPGTSLHELGLAIDFHNCSTRSSACYRWLATNALRYGIHSLPSEPWHWSTTAS